MSKIKVKVCDVADINANNFDFNDKKFVYYLDTGSITSNVVDSYQMLNTNEKIPIRARRAVKENTIVYSSVRPKLCHFGILRNLPENVVVSTGFITLDAKPNIDPDYLYNCITTKDKISYISKIADTSVSSYPSITPSDLANMEIEIEEDIMKQRNISKLLTNIDNKIANNNNIILNLESMAKTIYDYWFLQFNFPNEDGKPYKSSGGKMVWNDELKREIPEDWTVKTISNLMEISSNKIKPSEIGERIYAPIEVIPKNRMSFYETASINKATTGLCKFDSKSILLSNRRVYFHKVCISPFDGVTRDTVIIMNPKNKNNLGFSFQLVNSNHFIDYATLNSYGTEQPVLSPQTVMEYQLPYPNNELDIKYSSLVNSYIDKVLELERENRTLTELRNFLLPMFMNGQVTFKKEA